MGLALACSIFAAAPVSAQRMTDEELAAAIQNLNAPAPETRAAAVDLLSSRAWRNRRQLAPHFRRLLRDDPDWRVRASAGRAVGRLSLREAVPDIVRALRDRQVEVRVVAAAALWRLPDPAAVPALVDLLGDADPAARQWAALALGVVRDNRATVPLTRVLGDAEGAVRLDALRSLGRIADAAALDPLVRFASNEDRPMEERLEAINAIARLDGTEKVNALTRLLRSPNRAVRLQVVQALGEVGDALVIPALRRQRASERDSEIISAIQQATRAIEERASRPAATSGAPSSPLGGVSAR
ncbi:MAG: HEAT repeat domain-containing protein [Polyangiaceae bacterium]|nr:HEAT repeat domain-containing protein [Polyangiaceae bacterium]